MKTILLTIFHGAAAKNILRTSVLKTLLKEENVRVVCLMRFPDRVLLYQKDIPHERLVYDAFYKIPDGALERFFSFLKFRLIKTATTDLRHKMSYDSHGNYAKYVASLFFNWAIARKTIRQALRFIDYHLIGDSGFGSVLDEYRPDAVMVTNLFDDGETALLRESKKRSILTIGYVNSWDKITARSSIRLLPDKLIVFNQILKQEAVEHADMAEERVAVCGIPQYDIYIKAQSQKAIKAQNSLSREDFFRKKGLDPQKHLILYSPLGIRFWASDWAFIDFMHDAISGGRLPDCQLLVRFPPNDFLDDNELAKRPWLNYDLPGKRFGKIRSVDWDMDFGELEHLVETLVHMSVYVGYTSSFAVDAAIFDKPIIGINFELKENLPLSASPAEHYKTDHFKKVLQRDGIRLAGSRQELIDIINAYLRDPSLDREQRRRFVEEQCWRLDGKSGERVTNEVLKALH